MTRSEVVELIGTSHLLQPPLTALLAKRLGLRQDIQARTEVGRSILGNLGFAAIVLPTSLGVVLAVHADATLVPGTARTLAHLLACFWLWRLYRQAALFGVWPRTPGSTRSLYYLLVVIFLVQGPALGVALHADALARAVR